MASLKVTTPAMSKGLRLPVPDVPPKLHLVIACIVSALAALLLAAVIVIIAMIAQFRTEAVLIACVNALMWLGVAAAVLILALQIPMTFGRPEKFSASVGVTSVSAEFDDGDKPEG